MATEQAGKDAMAFIVSTLKRNKDVAYADVQKRAEAAGHTIYPINFGRAKALLGLVKVAPRKKGGGRTEDESSRSGQIRSLLREGMAVAEIARQLGFTTSLVYKVKGRFDKKAGRAARTAGSGGPVRGRSAARGSASRRGLGGKHGRTAASANGSVDSVVEVLREGERDRARLLKALEQIRAIVEGVG